MDATSLGTTWTPEEAGIAADPADSISDCRIVDLRLMAAKVYNAHCLAEIIEDSTLD